MNTPVGNFINRLSYSSAESQGANDPYSSIPDTGNSPLNSVADTVGKILSIFTPIGSEGGSAPGIIDTVTGSIKSLSSKISGFFSKGARTGEADLAYRYVGEEEKNVIEQTGFIPNIDKEGKLKDIFTSPNKYDTVSEAEDALQIGSKHPYGASDSPAYRVEFDRNAVQYNYAGNVESGTGIEMITDQSIPYKNLVPLED